MNQILLTDNDKYKKNDNQKNKYNNYNKSNTRNSADMKKIMLFFGVAILIFGVALIGVYGFKSLKKDKPTPIVDSKPQITIEKIEGSEEIKIIAKSEIGINKIIYTWNDGEQEELEMGGRTSHEQAMQLPTGENTLYIKVIDNNGKESETRETFTNITDKEKPKIEIDDKIGNGKIKITATDETEMQYITYRWNNDADTKVEVTNEGDTLIEETIDAIRGQNILTITAVDKANNSSTEEKTCIVVNKPEIEIWTEGELLYMKMSHDKGFKKIEFALNGQIYTYDSNFSGYDPDKKVIEYTFKLMQGENTVVIVAISNEDSQDTYKGKTTYTGE